MRNIGKTTITINDKDLTYIRIRLEELKKILLPNEREYIHHAIELITHNRAFKNMANTMIIKQFHSKHIIMRTISGTVDIVLEYIALLLYKTLLLKKGKNAIVKIKLVLNEDYPGKLFENNLLQFYCDYEINRNIH